MKKADVIVLNAGGLAGLVAASMYKDRGGVAMLFVKDGRTDEVQRLNYFRKQAQHFNISYTIELAMEHLRADHRQTGSPGGTGPKQAIGTRQIPEGVGGENSEGTTSGGGGSGLVWSQLLIVAGGILVRTRACELVWPVICGDDFKAEAGVTEQVQLVEQLIESESGVKVKISTPLAEMTDKQVIEVGCQMDVPWEIARSCIAPIKRACGVCELCDRRTKGFGAAGVADPRKLSTAPIS